MFDAIQDLSASLLHWHPVVFASRETGLSLCLLMWMGSLLLLNAVWLWIAGSALASWAYWGIVCCFAPHDKRSKTQSCISEWRRWFTSQELQTARTEPTPAVCPNASPRLSRFDGSYRAISESRPEVCLCLYSPVWCPPPPPPSLQSVAAMFAALNSCNFCWHSQDLSGQWMDWFSLTGDATVHAHAWITGASIFVLKRLDD